MFDYLARRFAALFRGLGVVALGAGLTACTSLDTSMDKVYLPESTQRIDVRKMRASQLQTGTHKDDYPEYTGAPDAHGQRPAYVAATGDWVYRDVDTTTSRRAPTADTSAVEVNDGLNPIYIAK